MTIFTGRVEVSLRFFFFSSSLFIPPRVNFAIKVFGNFAEN
jgi:hypothetical protein